MGEGFSDMEKGAVAGKPTSLEEIARGERDLRKLREYPELKAKIEAMLAIIENAGGDVEKAAETERSIIEELRQMGNEVLHGWARRQQQKKEAEYNAMPGVNRKKKKLYWYTRPGTIEIAEQIFTRGRQGRQIRPFFEPAEVKCRGYWEGLQRALTDFGADEAFAGAATKLKEHYGIVVPVSVVRGFTEAHGEAMRVQEKVKSDWPDRAGVPVLIGEMDGNMLPVVETAEPGGGEAAIDRRKTRQVGWKEAPLGVGAYSRFDNAHLWREVGNGGGSRRAAGRFAPCRPGPAVRPRFMG